MTWLRRHTGLEPINLNLFDDMKYSTDRIRELAGVAQRDPGRMHELVKLVARGRELLAKNPRSLAWRQISEAAVCAAVSGDLAAVKSFVAAGIAPDEVLPVYPWASTMLHFAMSSGGPEVLRFLVKQHPNLDVLNGRGRTPLHSAVDCHPMQREYAEILARAGADLSIVDPEPTSFGSPTRSKEFRESLRHLQKLGNSVTPKSVIHAIKTPMPWDSLTADGWLIVGLNHYRVGGVRHLFCSMGRNGRCITAEGADEAAVFEDLKRQAEFTSALS